MRWKSVSVWGPALSLILLLVALYVLHHELKHLNYHQIVAAVRSLPMGRVALAVLLTVLNYLILSGYEFLACRYIGKKQPFGRIALSSFIGNAFANTLGFAFISGSSVKFRLYTVWGLDAADVARVVAFTSASIWIGLALLGGAALMLTGTLAALAAGVVLMVLPLAYIFASAWWKRPFRVFGIIVTPPGLGTACAQTLLSLADWLLVAAVLFVLLPIPDLDALRFLLNFLVAQLTGVLSQTPGGIGVFESTYLVLSPSAQAAELTFAGLVAFRLIYYIAPLLLAGLLLALHEVVTAYPITGPALRASLRWSSNLAPTLLAGITFTAGILLLVSGATPAAPGRLEWLQDVVPLPLMEMSHFLGSVVGVLLLVLARGIQRRLDAAYLLSVLLVIAGIVISLLKGGDYEEALVLGLILLIFLPSRSLFYRKASLFADRFTPGWLLAIVAVMAAITWILLFSYKHMEYAGTEWWDFALKADISRSLRAQVGIACTCLLLGAVYLLRAGKAKLPEPQEEHLRQIDAIVAQSPETQSNLAYLPDKHFFFSESGGGFIMFGKGGRSWVSMGDPVCPQDEFAELVWRFREQCDREGVHPVFYEVGKGHLYVYLELGLTVLKLGEEAIVELQRFSLDGASRKNFRNTKNSLEKHGCTFTVHPASEVGTLLPELAAVSNSWLDHKNTREKRFSLGQFDADYLTHFPVAVVRQEGVVVAFANLWASAEKQELSIDLMRSGADAPGAVMDYLLCAIMLWGKQEGYARFNLGMAPLSGLSGHSLGPMWGRFGNFLYSHVETYYNFKGLRKYKEKFDPYWEPRFLVSPGGFALPPILADVASLISGGLKGVIEK